MGLDYWSGLVEGFQGFREKNYEKRFAEEQANRQRADRLFEYLLRSRDPEIQSMAISGLMNPIHRKKGFAGFMGAVDTDPYAAQITAAMNEMVPDSSAPTPTPNGGAGMSTNQPVHLGSENLNPAPGGVSGTPGIQLPPEPPPGVAGPQAGPGAGGPGAGGPGAGGPGPQAGPSMGSSPDSMGPSPDSMAARIPLPPGMGESKWKRRGTGVPTAEEIAEETERRRIMGKVSTAQHLLASGQAGLTTDDVHRVAMDAMGVPSSPRNFVQGSFAVILPGDPNGTPQPVSYDTSRGMYFLSDGKTPVPTGSKFVRMSGAGTGTGSGLTSTVKDTPEIRAQYQVDPDVPNTGYLKIKQLPDGTVQVMPTMYTPPPVFSGTGTILDTSGNPTFGGVTRGGSFVPIGTAVNPQPSNEQGGAQAVLEVVRQRVRAAEAPFGTRTKSLKPEEVDAIVRQAASEANPPLPYTGLVQLEAATKVPNARQVTPRPNAPKGTGAQAPGKSMAEQVREELMQRRGMVGPQIPSPPAPPPPSARSRGAGPGPVGARP